LFTLTLHIIYIFIHVIR